MVGLYTRAVIAGMLFGAWPLVMRYSGLSGNAAAISYAGISLACMLIYVFTMGGMRIETAYWQYAIIAGLLGAGGLILFGNGLMQAPKDVVGSFVVIMIVMQSLVPAAYQLYLEKNLSLPRALGFGAAIAAAILLRY